MLHLLIVPHIGLKVALTVDRVFDLSHLCFQRLYGVITIFVIFYRELLRGILRLLNPLNALLFALLLHFAPYGEELIQLSLEVCFFSAVGCFCIGLYPCLHDRNPVLFLVHDVLLG